MYQTVNNPYLQNFSSNPGDFLKRPSKSPNTIQTLHTPTKIDQVHRAYPTQDFIGNRYLNASLEQKNRKDYISYQYINPGIDKPKFLADNYVKREKTETSSTLEETQFQVQQKIQKTKEFFSQYYSKTLKASNNIIPKDMSFQCVVENVQPNKLEKENLVNPLDKCKTLQYNDYNKEKLIEKLITQNDQITKQQNIMENMKFKLTDIEKQKNELQDKLNLILENQKPQIKSDVNEEQNQNQMKKQIELLQEQCNILRIKLESKEGFQEEINHQLKKMKEENIKLTTVYMQNMIEKEEIQKNFDVQSINLEKTQNQLAILNEQLNCIQENHQQIMNQLIIEKEELNQQFIDQTYKSENQESFIQNIQMELKNQNNEISNLKNNLNHQNQLLQETQNNSIAQQTIIRQIEHSCEKLEFDKLEIEKEYQKVQIECQSLQKQAFELSELNRIMENNCSEMKKELAMQLTINQNLEIKNQQQELALQEQENKNFILKTSLKSLEASVQSKDEKLENQSKCIDDLVYQIKQSEIKNDQTLKELEQEKLIEQRLINETNELKKSSQNIQNEKEKQELKLIQAQVRIDKLQQQHQEEMKQMTNKQDLEIETLQQNYKELIQEQNQFRIKENEVKEKLVKEISELKRQKQQLFNEINQKDEEIIQVHELKQEQLKQIDQLTNSKQEIIQQNKEQLESISLFENTIQTLNDQLQIQLHSADNLNQINLDLQEQLLQVNGKLTEYTINLSTQSDQINENLVEIQQLKEINTQQQANHLQNQQQLSNQIFDIQEIIKEKQGEISKLQSEVTQEKQSKKKINKLNHTIVDQQTQIQQLEAKNQELQQRILIQQLEKEEDTKLNLKKETQKIEIQVINEMKQEQLEQDEDDFIIVEKKQRSIKSCNTQFNPQSNSSKLKQLSKMANAAACVLSSKMDFVSLPRANKKL